MAKRYGMRASKKKKVGHSDKGISIAFEKLADKSMVTESEWKSLRRRRGR